VSVEARIGVLISGRGSNMAALLYASRSISGFTAFGHVLVASTIPMRRVWHSAGRTRHSRHIRE
jgi:folate-dependent phosphoribosylglycinamide formyltransferase PurN